jgi:glycosyltransferase A (GT-A) superfamily protein (DUF2064 family)
VVKVDVALNAFSSIEMVLGILIDGGTLYQLTLTTFEPILAPLALVANTRYQYGLLRVIAVSLYEPVLGVPRVDQLPPEGW